jgi:hypothetical protein
LIDNSASALATHRASGRETGSVPAGSRCARTTPEIDRANSPKCCEDFRCPPMTAARHTTKALTPETTIAYDPEVE